MGTGKNPIDSFFKESLQDHTVRPSDEKKAAFLSEISASGTGRSSNKWIFLLPLVLLFVIGGGYGLYSILGTSETAPYSSAPAGHPETAVSAGTIDKTTEKTEMISKTDRITETPEKMINSSAKAQTTNLSVEATIQPADLSKRITAGEPLANSIPGPVSVDAKQEPAPPQPVIEMPAVKKEQADSSMTLKTGEAASEEPIPPAPDKPGQKQPKVWNILTGAYYQPEWMFNTVDDDKYVNNFGVTGTFQMKGFSVTTGVGISITKGFHELAVEYNDYLGSYKSLDSMSFSWNQDHTQLLPTYFMTDQKVWDSLIKLDYPKVEKRYTYLQIPLILGYDFIQTDHFSLGLRAGPVMSILLDSKVISQPYDAGENRIIAVNNITPDRINLNWQVMGGVAASVNLTKSLLFQLTPQVKYYFNSVYEKSDVDKKPWSVGVQGSFLIKL